MLLLLGPAVHERVAQDLGPGDERAADPERPPRELFCRDHHSEVVALCPRREAAVFLGHRQPEPA